MSTLNTLRDRSAGSTQTHLEMYCQLLWLGKNCEFVGMHVCVYVFPEEFLDYDQI